MSVGLFYIEFMLFIFMVVFVLCKIVIVMFSIEMYYIIGDVFDNVGFY